MIFLVSALKIRFCNQDQRKSGNKDKYKYYYLFMYLCQLSINFIRLTYFYLFFLEIVTYLLSISVGTGVTA